MSLFLSLSIAFFLFLDQSFNRFRGEFEPVLHSIMSPSERVVYKLFVAERARDILDSYVLCRHVSTHIGAVLRPEVASQTGKFAVRKPLKELARVCKVIQKEKKWIRVTVSF